VLFFHSSIRLHGVHKNSFIFIAQSSHAWLFWYICGWYIITELLVTLKVTFPILYSSSSLWTGDEIPCIVWRYQKYGSLFLLFLIPLIMIVTILVIDSLVNNWTDFFSEYLNMHFKQAWSGDVITFVFWSWQCSSFTHYIIALLLNCTAAAVLLLHNYWVLTYTYFKFVTVWRA